MHTCCVFKRVNMAADLNALQLAARYINRKCSLQVRANQVKVKQSLVILGASPYYLFVDCECKMSAEVCKCLLDTIHGALTAVCLNID